jgi:hypothetical protein
MRQRAKGLAHLAPALVLLSSALGYFGGEPFTWLTVAEITVGAAYVLLLVRELRHLRRHPHHRERVAWLELAAAGILWLEGYHIWHRHHEAQLAGAPERFHALPWVYAATGLAFVLLAFQMRRLDERRFLELRPDGFSLRIKPFGMVQHVSWGEVTEITPVNDADLLLRMHHGGQKRLAFGQLHDGPELRRRLLAHAAAARA